MMTDRFLNIRGIIFDLGYTLIEYKNLPWAQINLEGKQKAFEKLHQYRLNLPAFEIFDKRLEAIKEEFRASAYDKMEGWQFNHVVSKLLMEFGIDSPEKYADEFVEIFYGNSRSMNLVADDTVGSLRKLKENGYHLGVISNSIYPGKLHDADLELLGLAPFIDFAIYSSEFGYRKPHPKIFHAGLKAIGLEASETIYVGDRYDIDAVGARKVGMVPIIKYCTKEKYPEPMPPEITVIKSISELPDLLNLNTRDKMIENLS